MEIDLVLLLTAFAGGYLVSRWQCRHHLLINLALRSELMGMRRKVHCNQSDKTSKVPPYKRKLSRRLPRMPWWAKVFLGFLSWFCPKAVSYNQFHPSTMNAWAKKLFLTSTYISLLKKWAIKQKIQKDRNRAKKPGRPRTPQYVVDNILAIKKENPGYSPGMISRMPKSQLQIFIHKKTVQAILKENGYPPNPPGRIHPPKQEPAWKALFNNQIVAAIDFKNIIDLWGNQVFILNIIHHGRRYLIRSTATYHPTALWLAQQIREAFPYDTTIPFPERNFGNVKSVSWVGGFHHSYYWAA